MTSPKNNKPTDWATIHLWQVAWVRDLVFGLVVLMLIAMIYAARSITAPVALALILAYLFNPLLEWTHHKWKLPRLWGTVILLAVGVITLLVLLVVGVPLLIEQSGKLVTNAPQYFDQLTGSLRLDWAQLREKLQQLAQTHMQPAQADAVDKLTSVDVGAIADAALTGLGVGVGVLGSVLGAVTYLALFIIVLSFSFFFFSWKLQPICDWFVPLIPVSHKDETLRVIGKMDEAIASFVRGRLIQATIMGVILSIGWLFTGVPFWLLLGLGCGVLNLIPYAAVFGWVAALVLVQLDYMSVGGDDETKRQALSLMLLLWPSLVYFGAQLFDGWVVEPIVQGKATNLDPLTVLLAVLIGGTLAGLLGMVVAIPIAACVKIFAREVVLPRLREYAANRTSA